MAGQIRIVSRPDGEAPDEIRDAWIGLTLPLLHLSGASCGVVSEKIDFEIGYAVTWEDAMNALLDNGKSKALHWWLSSVTPCGLVFDLKCAEIIPSN